MPLIRSGLGDNTDHSAADLTVFSRIVALENVKFRNRVRIRVVNHTVVEQVVVQPAIQKKRNGISAPAGDAVSARRSRIAVGFGNAGLQEREVQDVSAIQRSALNGF